MRFLCLSLGTIVLFSLSVKGCQFCLNVVSDIFKPKVNYILTNEDKKYFCNLLENVINELIKDQKIIEIFLDEDDEKDVNKDDETDFNEKEVKKDNVIIEFDKQSVCEENVSDNFIRSSLSNKEKPRWSMVNFDTLSNRFPIREKTLSKNDASNSENFNLLTRLKNDQKSLKALDLKLNKLKMEAASSQTKETPKRYFCFSPDRPWC